MAAVTIVARAGSTREMKAVFRYLLTLTIQNPIIALFASSRSAWDGPLDDDVMADIDVAIGNIASGSLFLLSVRASAKDFGTAPSERLERLRKAIPGKVSTTVDSGILSENRFPEFLWKMIDNEIRNVIVDRNSGLRPETAFEYSQIFNFRYSDGAPMLTVGGLVSQAGQRTIVSQCDFESLQFAKTDASHHQITVAKLTNKKQRALNEQLPSPNATLPGVPTRDVQAYASNYRYSPTFVETEL